MSIWQYPTIKKLVLSDFQLTMDEGDTPLEEYALNGQKICIKREDANPTGSAKDRSIAFLISYYLEKGHKHFTISSSGNAAKSAIKYCLLKDISLDVFVSDRINPAKLALIKEYSKNSEKINFHLSKRAKSDAIKFAYQNSYINLRGSTDDNAIVGFKTLGYELSENTAIDAIFIPTSSGTTALGVFQGYKDLGKICPPIHIVQTERIHPLAADLDQDFKQTNKSKADAITDKVAKRKEEILQMVKETNGGGFIISDAEIENAIKINASLDINYPSPNSNLALAGLLKALEKGKQFNFPCLIFTGL